MGNPGIIYDRTTIDLGAQGVVNVLPGTGVDGARLFWGTGQSVVTWQGRRLTIDKGPFYNDQALYRALSTFWASWASKGLPFAFAADLAKTAETVIWADTTFGQLLTNGDVDAWTGTYPDGWTFTAGGGTTVTRETEQQYVRQGLYSIRWDRSGTGTAVLTGSTYRALASGTAFELYLRWKVGTINAGIQYSIEKGSTAQYAQNTTPTWAGTQVWFSAGTATTRAWQEFTQAFGTGLDATTVLRVHLRNISTVATQFWADDVQLRRTGAAVLAFNDVTGFTAGDAIRLISRAGHREELTTISSIAAQSGDGSYNVTLAAQPVGRWDGRDIVRSQDYFPNLLVDQDEPAIVEEPGSLFRLRLRCREALTGRT